MRRIVSVLALLCFPTIAGAQYLQQSFGIGGGYGSGQSFSPVGGIGTCGNGAALGTMNYGTCGNVGSAAVVLPQQQVVSSYQVQQQFVPVQQAIVQQEYVQTPVIVQQAVPVYINRSFGINRGYGHVNRGFGLSNGVGYGVGVSSGVGYGVNQNVGLGLASARRFRGVQQFRQGRNGQFRGRQRIRGRL